MPTAHTFSSALPYPRPFHHRIDALRKASYRQMPIQHSLEQQAAAAEAPRLPITPRQPRSGTSASATLLPGVGHEAQQLMLQALVAGFRQLASYPTLQAEA